MAPTGTAAANIDGETIHKLIGVRRKSSRCDDLNNELDADALPTNVLPDIFLPFPSAQLAFPIIGATSPTVSDPTSQ